MDTGPAPAAGETQNVSPARQAAVYRRGMCQNVCRMCVECVLCVLCVFPCVLTRYSFYCDIVICGAIWAAAAPVTGAALSEEKTLFTALHLLLATAWVHIQEDEFAAFLSTILVAFHISLIMKMREYVTNYLPMVHPTPPHTTAPHTFYNYTK